MFRPGEFRNKARVFGDQVSEATAPDQRRELQALEKSFTKLADNEQWLADNHDKTVSATAFVEEAPVVLAAEEEHVLRCLGAALIMQWTTLPTKLQRELFDHAGSMGALMKTPELRGQIARFLHKHKDDDEEAQRIAVDGGQNQ